MSIKPGALRFNTDSMKLEIFRGSPNYEGSASMAGIGTLAAGQWEEIVATSPQAQTGGARGVFMGGGDPGRDSYIQYINISSTGNAITFGNLNNATLTGGGFGSKVRGFHGGGETSPAGITDIDFVTISSTGNATSFGNLIAENRQGIAGASNSIRGVFAGGFTTPAKTNVIQYITMASAGDAQDFGDLVEGRDSPGSHGNSSTRGIFCAGHAPTQRNYIEFITLSTLGNTADFGDTATVHTNTHLTAVCSATRGLYAGGMSGPAYTPYINTIEYVTISTLGNSKDFGDLTNNTYGMMGTSSTTRGIFAGGADPVAVNVIQYVQISSLGNAIDFGDLNAGGGASGRLYGVGVSNGHGGL